MSDTVTLLVSCSDRTGIVAALTDLVFRNGGNIVDLDQHAEVETGLFSMRLSWSLEGFLLDEDSLTKAIDVLAARFELRWQLFRSSRRPRIAVFVSKTDHCLYDLLLRQRLDELDGDVVAVVSNHPDLAEACRHFEIPFHHIPVGSDKAVAEQAQRALLADLDVDLVVLARYMQILSEEFVADWQERMINIHHSFLPAFIGARPYHQAKARGVKLIGATAHYVTAELDQGPIIEQDVTRVTHRDEVPDLVRAGRDLERQVLSRAVRLHCQHRVLVEGGRTVVFR
jgi:formyltetrahydrofolate deformylase